MKTSLAVLLLSVAVAPVAAHAADLSSVPAASRNKVEQCIGCHAIPEYKTAYPEVYRVPMIGGQSAKYLEAALQAYKKGDRQHPQMTPTAQTLSDQDITLVAAYFAQQTPTAGK